jgi:hypothetical protein
MNYLNIMLYTLVGYAALVLLAATLIWRIQPAMDGGVTITVTPDGDTPIQRNLYGFERDGTLFVSSNHWFRQWYNAALENPDVDVTLDGVTRPFTAEAVQGEEHERLSREYNMGFVLRLICGFAPSKFLRLEPQS